MNTDPPCIGCGYCCAEAPCFPAMWRFGTEWTSPCPALQWNGERHLCGAALERPELSEPLGFGLGCIAPRNPWQSVLVDRTQLRDPGNVYEAILRSFEPLPGRGFACASNEDEKQEDGGAR